MEMDTINVVKLPNKIVQRRMHNPLPYALIEQNLQRDIGHWAKLLRTTAERKEVRPRSRTYQWSDVDVTEVLPTDLLTYFVYELEPDIAPEIGKLLIDGRVHLVLVLSHHEFPQKDWCRNFKLFGSTKMICDRGIMVASAEHGEPLAPLVQLHEMRAFTGRILGDLLEVIEERKKKYDFDWN